MRVVLDANIIISALLGSKRTLNIITSKNFQFYAPHYIIQEIIKHKKEIYQKAGYSQKEFEDYFRALLKFITIIRYERYAHQMKDADEIIGKRDNNDIEYVACTLAISADFIWTNDKDFTSQKVVPVKNTHQIIGENQNI